MDAETWVPVGLAAFGLAIVGGFVTLAIGNPTSPAMTEAELVQSVVDSFPQQFGLRDAIGIYRIDPKQCYVASDNKSVLVGVEGYFGGRWHLAYTGTRSETVRARVVEAPIGVRIV